MAVNAKIGMAVRALLALSTALTQTQRAIFLLKEGDADISGALGAANEKNTECLQYVEKLIALIEKDGE